MTRTYVPSDVYRFIESLKHRPETYKTILLDAFDNKSTETTKIRKKISKFVNQGFIASGLLEGESGTKIFYSLDKKYFIFILRVNGSYHHHYCSDVDEFDDNVDSLVMYNSFVLRDSEWDYLGNIVISKETIHRWW